MDDLLKRLTTTMHGNEDAWVSEIEERGCELSAAEMVKKKLTSNAGPGKPSEKDYARSLRVSGLHFKSLREGH